jgi:hypothetical protein
MSTEEMLERLKVLNPRRHTQLTEGFRIIVEDILRENWGREPKAAH